MTIRKLLFATGLLLCASFNLQASDSNSSEIQSNAPMPLPFTKNIGQWPDSILFRASANGATMWFTKNGIWYQFFRRVEKSDASATAIGASVVGGPSIGRVPVNSWAVPPQSGIPPALSEAEGSAPSPIPGKFGHERDSIETTMIKAEFVGASESVEVVGLEELEYKCNYFIGNERDKWRTDVPNYSAVTMHGLYPGVDVTFSTKDGRLHEELTTSTSGSLTQVKVEYHGADGVIPQTPWAADVPSAPVLDEHTGYAPHAIVHTSFGEHSFEGVLLSDGLASKSEGQVASTASSASGVSLVYSTYLGGINGEMGIDIAVDGAGNAYIAGMTGSPDFPTVNPYDGNFVDGAYAFISKLNPSGTALVYSTFFGGGDFLEPRIALFVDSVGYAYVSGYTSSTDFPIVNAYDRSLNGPIDVFVTKFSPMGNSLEYSTYLGGGVEEWAGGIAVDDSGNAYIIGETSSDDFPTINSFDGSHGGYSDAFITKLSPSGNDVVYSTFLGGSNMDVGLGISVDDFGYAYLTGFTFSSDFSTINAYDGNSNGGYDGFISKLNPSGNDLVYSTYVGGSNDDIFWGIAVDGSGNAYVAGYTHSMDFPTANAYDATSNGGADAVISKLNPAGNGLVYSTYLGGNGNDFLFEAVEINDSGNAYVAGMTRSSDFPIVNAYDENLSGYYDVFVTKFSSSGSALVYSTYIGGSDDEDGLSLFYGGTSVAVDGAGNAYVVGRTFSSDFPIVNGYDGSPSGFADAFVAKLGRYPCCFGSRGNVDGDAGEAVNVSDVTYFAQYLFQGGGAPLCKEEADVAVANSLNIVDLTTLVAFLFSGGAPLPACP